MKSVSFSYRLFIGIATIVSILLLVSALSYNTSSKTKLQMKALTDRHLPQLVKGQLMFNEINTIARALRNMQVIGNSTPADAELAEQEWQRITKARAEIEQTMKQLEARAASHSDQELLKRLAIIHERRDVFAKAQDEFKRLFQQGDLAASRLLLMGELRTKYNAYRDEILALTEHEQTAAQQNAEQLVELSSSRQQLILLVSLVGIVVASLIALLLLRRVRLQLGGELEALQRSIDRIAQGDLTEELRLVQQDGSSVMARLQQMQLKLRQSARLANENARIRTALDCVTTSVMISNAEREIVYCNSAQMQLFTKVESAIQKELPNFAANAVLGRSIDSLYRSAQQQVLARLSSTHHDNIVLGGRNFALNISPVIDDNQSRIGLVFEWQDQTDLLAQQAREKQASDERSRILGALDAASTNLMLADAQRNIMYMNHALKAMLTAMEPELRQALPNFSVGQLMGYCIDQFHPEPAAHAALVTGLKTTHRSQISLGGRTLVTIINPVFDTQGVRLGSIVEWIDRTAEVAVENEINTIVESAVVGNYSLRIRPDGKDGFMLKLAEGMNQLMASNQAVMTDIARMLQALAKGDLTQEITADYQGLLGQLKNDCNSTSQRLAAIVTQIKEAANTIQLATQEIAVGNADLSQRTEQQAASIEETASSMEELTVTVKQNAEHALQANQLAISTSDIAKRGGQVVGQVVATMAEISESATKIVDIISVIDGIAFQTNILALNAAVEAARAGEQGRGFAVVAAEVRNLAQRSANASKEIKTLIGNSVLKVAAGTKLADEAGNTMQDVVTAVSRVTTIMSEISTASNEQRSGIEQINQSINQMDENTQQNAALVEQAAAAAENLNEQAGLLTDTVGIFQLPRLTANTMVSNALQKAGKPTRNVPQVTSKPRVLAARSVGKAQVGDDEWESF